MIKYSRESLRLTLIFVLFAGALWLVFAPIQLGGQTSYVIINGNSMEPDFKIGDLVVARKMSFYEVDQRVVYTHPKIGFVFHRIIGQENNQFILKGDNNDWIDSYQPAYSDIVGKFWFLVPGGGSIITKLREPVYFSIFALIILVILFSVFFFENDETSSKRKSKNKVNMNKENSSPQRESRQDLLLLLGIIAVAALILGGISYARPLNRKVMVELPYRHQGEFNYSAPDPAGIYDSPGLTTGDPVYSKLNCILDLNFNYQFIAPNLSDVEKDGFSGTYLVYAEISDIDGWNRSFILVPETEFNGTTSETWMLLDICRVQSLFIDKEEKTAIENRKYNLSIFPRVAVSGSVGGMPIAERYNPEISFQVDTELIRLLDGIEGLKIDQEGSIMKPVEVKNYLLIFGQEFTVSAARNVSLIILGITILGAILPIRSIILDLSSSDQSRIQFYHNELLINVEKGSSKTKTSHVIEVSSFQDLIKMAERYGTMILHESRGKTHHYSIQDEGNLYRYSMVEPKPPEE